jgi:hypothetical protein
MNRLYRLMDAVERFDRRWPQIGILVQRVLGWLLLAAASHLIITVVLDPKGNYWNRLAALWVALNVIVRVAIDDARREKR